MLSNEYGAQNDTGAQHKPGPKAVLDSGPHATEGAVLAAPGLFESVFRPATAETVDFIEKFVNAGRPNMLLAGTYANAESAKLAYLLSRLVGKGTNRQHRHVTFFGNSTVEALSGAIKLARHTSVRAQRKDDGRVIIVDPTGIFKKFLSPTSACSDKALAPGVVCVPTVTAASEHLCAGNWSAAGIVRTSTPNPEVEQFLADAKSKGALRIIINSELSLDDLALFDDADMPPGEVYVFGESLADRQVPFGCFTMTRSAYAVWHNSRDSTLHTSTFGGNGLCLAIVLDRLAHRGLVTPQDRDVFRQADSDMATRLKLFKQHVNPHIAAGMEAFGFAFDIAEARGSRLTFADGRTVLDCAGGTGANLRGHNPRQVIPAVLRDHDTTEDYFAHLSAKLHELTGYPHAIPAVSGATAVDAAVSMAMLASRGKTGIVTFTGNYSGKSLISLNFSKYGPQSVETDRDAFRPYYHKLHYIDPFSKTAVTQLRSTLSSGDIGLVWLEIIQGMQCKPLPEELIDTIASMRDHAGYLIGVDEVMTGVWRASDDFLYHQRLPLRADVVSLAKPLSDMILPLGLALVSDDVYRRARTVWPDTVDALESYYRCGLSAHIAINALNEASSPDAQLRLHRNRRALNQGLTEVADTSPLFDAVAGEGNLLRLVPRRNWFPVKPRSTFARILELAISEIVLDRGGVLIAQLRFFPALLAEPSDIDQALTQIKDCTADLTPAAIYRHTVERLWQLTRSNIRTAYRARRRTRRPQ
jgi:acetylornithine/succinyldiaminopimelate/putrescine aminotransferase